MKTLRVLVCGGFISLAYATHLQAAQPAWPLAILNNASVCSLSLKIDSCTNSTVTPNNLVEPMRLSVTGHS
ncbi:MAG: hypothetical protein ACRDHZ_19675, partial [Ktedonobacteraceae bacterium]